jgi:hypothetical protein
MARFRVASRALFQSHRVCVSARFSLTVDVWSPSLVHVEGAERHERMLIELGHYTTPAEVRDLEAALDRYPDTDTAEIRAVLADRRISRDHVPR